MELINLHTHQYTNASDVLEVVNQYPMEFDANIPWYSIGLHPWKIDENTMETELAFVKTKLQEDNCLALGECGLDKRTTVPFDLQLIAFEKQLQLAQRFNKPVIIHCVAAFQEVIAMKNRLGITVPMIIHGFSKTQELAKQLTDHGFYISFGKYLLRNPELEIVFKSIPNNRFFLETDTIEEGINEVYAKAAACKKINLDELKQLININFQTVFRNRTVK